MSWREYTSPVFFFFFSKCWSFHTRHHACFVFGTNKSIYTEPEKNTRKRLAVSYIIGRTVKNCIVYVLQLVCRNTKYKQDSLCGGDSLEETLNWTASNRSFDKSRVLQFWFLKMTWARNGNLDIFYKAAPYFTILASQLRSY